LAANVDKARGWQTGIETFSRLTLAGVNAGASSGRIDLAIFTPARDLTVGTASVFVVTIGTAITLARLGLYTWDQATGTATLVARTANDPTISGTALTVQSRAFDTTGGYPSTYTLTAGSVYGFGMIQVGTTPATRYLHSIQSTFSNLILKSALFKNSQADLSTVGTWSDNSQKLWGRLT
jgi:hypothetical protein